jgi:LPXTG-site transpeptidase (sortase) family protein
MTARSLAIGALALVGLGVIALVLGPGLLSRHQNGPAEIRLSVRTEPLSPEPQTQAESKPAVGIARLVVPALSIDAPMVVLGVDSDGVMEAPSGPADVGWYNFSGLPEQGRNIVVSGHVDYHNYGPAVFWRLREAKAGEVVQLLLEDQSVATYRVVSTTDYEAKSAPVQEIIGSTDVETLTLITCGGNFNSRTREYDRRLVLRAIRA